MRFEGKVALVSGGASGIDPFRPGSSHGASVRPTPGCLSPAGALLLDDPVVVEDRYDTDAVQRNSWSTEDAPPPHWPIVPSGATPATVRGTFTVIDDRSGAFTADIGGTITYQRGFGHLRCSIT